MKLHLLLLLALTVVIARVSLAQDDNDFDDFDMYEETVPEIQKPSKTKDEANKNNFVDNDADDDGLVEDEFDHFSDKDEFEGFGGADSSDNIQESADLKKTGEPTLTMTKVPMNFRTNWDSYYVEILFVAGLIVYFANYLMGKSKNIKIANSWLIAHKSFLEENFALIGDDGKKEADSSQPVGLMIKESDSVFTLWCSGRVCCEGMLIELKLIKRQDLLALSMGILSSKVQDQVVIKAEISKDSMDSFVFAVCNKRSASKMMKDMTDLKQFCVSVAKADEKYNLPTGFSVLSEIQEASSAVLDARVVAMLHKYSDIIESIHISDQFTGPQPAEQAEASMKPAETKKMITVSFFINEKTGNMEDFKPLVQLVIYLIDKLKRFKLSREGKTKADKNRSRVEEEFLKSLHSMRMEAAAQKVSEKRKQEKEKLMAEDNVEKQIKLEKKMKRKDAKKAMPKTKSMSINL